MKWNRDTGKPYIRRANGREQPRTMRDAFHLAHLIDRHGPRGFYVMVQRRCGPDIMAAAPSRRELVGQLVGARRGGFRSWANRVKRIAQGPRQP